MEIEMNGTYFARVVTFFIPVRLRKFKWQRSQVHWQRWHWMAYTRLTVSENVRARVFVCARKIIPILLLVRPDLPLPKCIFTLHWPRCELALSAIAHFIHFIHFAKPLQALRVRAAFCSLWRKTKKQAHCRKINEMFHITARICVVCMQQRFFIYLAL